MALTINTNLSSLMVQNSMAKSTNSLNKAIERMTTGFKINSAKDDAASYAIASKMMVDLSSYDVVRDNAQMGISLLNTASDSLDLINTHLQRIRDLTEQASNETYNNISRAAIQAEIDARTSEINRIIGSTEYNGINLYGDGSGATNCNFISNITQLTESEAIAQGYTIIKTKDDLNNIRNDLDGKYILMNDIDLSGVTWSPIGNMSSSFTGEFNGNGYIINGLSSVATLDSYVGLFGSVSSAEIKNLGMENVNIQTVGTVHAGAIVGSASDAIVTNCYVVGNIQNSSSGCIGLLIGSGPGTAIDSCYSSGMIYGTGSTGGIAGQSVTITNSSSSATIICHGLWVEGVTGGLVGGEPPATATNSYFTGTIQGSTGNHSSVACIANTVTNCYYTGGPYSGPAAQITEEELLAKIEAGDIVKSAAVPASLPTTGINLQIGIRSTADSTINIDTSFSCRLNVGVSTSESATNSLAAIDSIINKVSQKQTEWGSSQNRIDSIIESIDVARQNITSSLSTIRDADIANVSSEYIKAQILQNASSTLLATANQSPSIVLQLI